MPTQHIPATRREYYDWLVRAARDGTFPATTDPAYGGECRYRLDGTPECPVRCAAGVLIPDDDYDQKMEGNLVESDRVAPYIKIPAGMTLTDIMAIQRIHDELSYSDNWNPDKFIHRLDALPCFQSLKVPEHVELGGEG